MPASPRHPPPLTTSMAASTTATVASAGLLPAATLAERLGIGEAADASLHLARPGAANPGAKLLTLVHGMLAGGDCIHDVDVAWLRRHRQRAGPPGHGAVHGRDVPARLHPRPHPPARPPHRADPCPRIAGGRRPRRRRDDDRWTPPSSRCTATTSRAPATATPAPSATTRCWPPAPPPARCCWAERVGVGEGDQGGWDRG